MDLERLLRETKPEVEPDLTVQNARVLTALLEQVQPAEPPARTGLIRRFFNGFIESPIPTLTASAAVISFFLWQASLLLGTHGMWIGRAAAFVMNRGLLP